MFIHNAWYVAAEPHEIGEIPLARTILDTPVVIFKTQSGSVAALEDRCPHRFAPLSLGKIVGETLQCSYHGAQFSPKGNFVVVPGQNSLPNACVRSFPLLKKYGYFWIWMGDDALSDDHSSIPDFFFRGDHHDWDGGYGHFESIQAGYDLINDNLFDITHAEYVHPGSFGGQEMRIYRNSQPGMEFIDQKMTYSIGERSITFRIRSQNMETGGPFYRWMVSNHHGVKNYEGNIDLDMQVDWGSPSYTSFLLNARPSGTPREQGAEVCNMHAITPEHRDSSHYFYRSVKNFGGSDLVSVFMKGVESIFEQDKPLLENQQRSLRGRDIASLPAISFSGDMLLHRARRINQGLIQSESASRITSTNKETS